MKKSLILFRHAHAQWQSEQGPDHQRILSPKGEKQAKFVGLRLKELHALPQKIYCSSATRAQSTANIAHQEGDWGCPIEIDETLYNTDADHTLNYIHQLSDTAERIMLVGHEPTWSEISNRLTTATTSRLAFSTAMLVEIQFDADSWSDIQIQSGALHWILGPDD